MRNHKVYFFYTFYLQKWYLGCRIGMKVGSDIPFCIKKMASRVQGKGDILTPIKMKKSYMVLIVSPKQGLSTKDVYLKYDEIGSNQVCDTNSLIEGLQKDDINLIHNSCANQLEEAATAIYPGLKEVKLAMENEGLKPCVMTGSGSTLFYISNDAKLMKKAYNTLLQKGFKVVLTKTI